MTLDIHRLAAPFLTEFRRKRMRRFVNEFGVTEKTRVLDVGGNAFNWQFVDRRPLITFLNIDTIFVGTNLDRTDRVVVADGCNLPFKPKSFDVVFCNSVIEHLASEGNQKRMAREIDRVGRAYFVQTPNYWFPIEPHYLAPGVQFVPPVVRPFVGRWLTPWGWLQKPSTAQAHAFASEIRLLKYRDMCGFFPNGRIVAERAAGLTKSWIAVRR